MKAKKPDKSNNSDKIWQPMKAGCQTVAKAIEPDKLLSKDNNLKSTQRKSHWNVNRKHMIII